MFTGIIESMGVIKDIIPCKGNIDLVVHCDFTVVLKIDQSIAHNGVCLTVVELNNEAYRVTAIEETLEKTSLKTWKVDDFINLERGAKIGDRIDGHLVQGHVDQTGICTNITQNDGSWLFEFEFDPKLGNLVIEKGSITVDGVSLTVVNAKKDGFSVAIIPYTFQHTRFQHLKVGDAVNLEFDLIGKYVKALNHH